MVPMIESPREWTEGASVNRAGHGNALGYRTVLDFPAMQVLQRPDWHGSPVHLGELFMVRKNNVEARCVLRSHQFGWELCLQVGLNRDFLQTKVCRTQEEVLSTGEEWKAAMIEKGWS
jgi:hypothetical protein